MADTQPAPASFEQALGAVEGVEGWMTDDQARRLFERARSLAAPATIVEIGSYRGRSAIVLAQGAPDGVAVVAIDPHAGNDRGPQQLVGSSDQGQADNDAFRGNLERAGVAGRVRHVRLPSQDALGAVEGEVDLLYVDGAHRYAPARDDIARWGERVRPGGALLIHDSFSSVGVTLAIMRLLSASGDWSYVGRSGSLAEYRRERPASRARNCGRQLAQLPWFARNLAIKVLLTLRLKPLARALGSDHWPY
ncbi:MAG TPA: class I SAM-dependent methyltransferase [Thermoleophilaceae bacterium]